MARAPIKTKEDPRLIRPIEEMVKVGDPSKLMALGWKPEREIDAAVAQILDYWRNAKETG